MSLVTTEVLTDEEARRRLDEFSQRAVESFGSIEGFLARAEAYELDPAGRALYDRIRELEYLLSE